MIAAILLAAGGSRRMGAPKPLIAWGDGTLIEWEYAQLMATAVDEIVIVCGARMEQVHAALGNGGRHIVFNALWPQGRATSLARGAMALLREGREQPEAVLVQNVDQPTRPQIIDRLIEERRAEDHDVVQPSYIDATDGGEHGGHPVVVAGRLLEELAMVSDRSFGLRAILERHPPHRVPFERDPAVWVDLDTPDVVDTARKVFGVDG